MLKRTLAVLMFCAAAVPMGAFANTPIHPYLPPSGSQLSWDQLKEDCVHPEHFGHQMPPTDIHVECADTVTSWRQESLQEGTSHSSLSVFVTTNKVQVAPVVIESGTSNAACMQLVEESRSRRLPLNNVTCEEIRQFNTAQDYCIPKLANVEMPPDGVLTGRKINTCNINVTTSANL